MNDILKVQRPPDDPRTTDELLRLALEAYDDDDAFWDAIRPLHWRGTREVFDVAAALATSGKARERELAMCVISQLGIPDRSFPEEGEAIVLDVLSREKDPDVLEAIGYAIGFTGSTRSLLPLLELSRHENPRIREASVHGLDALDDDPRASDRLVQLTEDPVVEVRDWATFGIGAMPEPDSPKIREALVRRLQDEDENVRGEALRGLASRKDPRVFEALVRALSGAEPEYLALDAAGELGDERLYPLLQKYAARSVAEEMELADALEACRPPGE